MLVEAYRRKISTLVDFDCEDFTFLSKSFTNKSLSLKSSLTGCLFLYISYEGLVLCQYRIKPEAFYYKKHCIIGCKVPAQDLDLWRNIASCNFDFLL